MIEAFVRAAIETTSDEAAKPRLRRCVPPLLVAVKNWAGSPAGEVVMAAATPKAAFMFVADDWPDIDEGELQTHEVARALVGAIESSAPNKSDVILGATAALLGEAGLDAQREEQERIADNRGDPAGGDPGRARWPHRCGNGDGDTDARGDDALKKNPGRQRGSKDVLSRFHHCAALSRAQPRGAVRMLKAHR
jgi:hypothetical protein